MIVQHTAPGTINDRTALGFSNEEIERVKEICEELKEIFNANSVALHGEISNGLPVNYTIDITGCPATNIYE